MYTELSNLFKTGFNDKIPPDDFHGLSYSFINSLSFPLKGSTYKTVWASAYNNAGTVAAGGSMVGLRTDPTVATAEFPEASVLYQPEIQGITNISMNSKRVKKAVLSISAYSILLKWNNLFFYGNPLVNPGDFEGIETKFAGGIAFPASQSISAAAGFTIKLLLDLLDRLAYSQGVFNIVIARKEFIRLLADTLASTGVRPVYVYNDLIGKALKFAGFYFIRNDSLDVPAGVPETTKIYVFNFGPRGVHYKYPAELKYPGLKWQIDYRNDNDSYLCRIEFPVIYGFSSNKAVATMSDIDVSAYMDV